MLLSSNDTLVPTTKHQLDPFAHIQVSFSQLTGAMYIRHRFTQNHRPKKHEKKKLIDPVEPSDPLKTPPSLATHPAVGGLSVELSVWCI